MPEIRECFIHYKHTHYVLVEQLKLGQGELDWTLQDLFADATDEEVRVSGGGGPSIGLTNKHCKGYVDQIGSKCLVARGQKSHQTRIWPGNPKSPKTPDGLALPSLDGLVLSGLSYTPRSLILIFGKLDLQV
jgi:hypothetical protein